MKKFIILFALVALACAAPVSLEDERDEREERKEPIHIVTSDRNNEEDGSYQFNYEGSDGSIREESASVVDKGTEDEAIEIHGSYSYIDANGDTVQVNYTAGKNGFVPVGTIIPKEITEVAEAAKDLPKQFENSQEELSAPSRE